MSEGEVAQLRRMIEAVQEENRRMHADAQQSRREEREMFQQSLAKLQESFVTALKEMTNQQTVLNGTLAAHGVLLAQCMGTGQPGEGRLGLAEGAIEDLKKVKWQLIAVVTVLLYMVDKVLPLLRH